MRAWRPDRQPAFYASPCRFESCRALCCPRGGRETMRASEARGAGSTPAGDADGGIGQRQAARPSTWKRWVRFPLPSPCSRSSLARSPGLQPDRVGSRRASLGANHRGRVWEGKRVGAPTRSPPIRIDGGSKPLGSTACPRSLMEQAPDYGSGSWGFESSRGCNGSGAGAQSRLIRATWRDRHPREPHSDRSVAQWQGRGPTNRRRSRGERRAVPGANHRGRSGGGGWGPPPFPLQTTTRDSLRSDHARVSIWRGCPAVYRVRRVRFPSRAQTWRSSRQSGRSIGERLGVRVSPPGSCPRPDHGTGPRLLSAVVRVRVPPRANAAKV